MRRMLLAVLVPVAWAQAGVGTGTSSAIARGDKLFAQGCAVGYCHGAGGSAARSQRLRGRSFEREYLLKVIRVGIPNTAMPAWGDRLTETDLSDLADYIQSLASAPVAVTGAPTAESPQLASVTDRVVDTPDEQRAGRDLFFDLTRESRCSVCHRLNGTGTAVGPDITKVSALQVVDGPRVLRYGRPRQVRTVVLKGGERFAGVPVDRGAAMTRVYDLSAVPPVLRTLASTEIQSTQRQTAWRHAAAVRSYSPEELQTVWDFVRHAAGKK